jgi:mannobiose 2-epimerase
MTTGSEIVEQARSALRQHVLEPFAPRCIDRDYGGFLVDFDGAWRAVGPHEKTLEHASRTTLAFTLLDQAFPDGGYERFVRHGCAFLQQAMWDSEHGGFYARVDRSGRPLWEGLKHPHAVIYAAQAFLLAAPRLAHGEGLSWARKALEWLDGVAWDHDHAGYWGSFRRNNDRYAEGETLPTPDGRDPLGLRPGLKELNTLGDAIEMLTVFTAHGFAAQYADRLARLVDLVTDRIASPLGGMPYLFTRDWRVVPDVLRLGLNFQMIHRLMAVEAASGATEPIKTARHIADFCLGYGRHPSGGYCFAVAGDGRSWPATGPATDSRQWWVQFEAAHALHVMASSPAVEGAARTRYALARDTQWAFLRDHYFDTRIGGIHELAVAPFSQPARGLVQRLRPQSSRPRLRKAHGWKDPWHEVLALLTLSGECAMAT